MDAVIGIGGGTNSGKTTLCKTIAEDFPGCFIFNQDKYFKTIEEAKLSFLDCDINWEKCEALNMDDLVKDVKGKINEKRYRIIIVEGHLVLNYPPLVELFDVTVFITLNYDLAFKRRLTRTYDPPDSPEYFENVVWPGYLSILNEVSNVLHFKSRPIFLDATDPNNCYCSIYDLVKSYLSEDIKNY